MTRLQLSLFGSPRLEADGAPIEIATRKALALLVYLALADAPASRESLAARFWPEQDERKARGSLRRALWVIRQGVGDGILVAGRSAVSIAGDAELAVDAHQFRDLLADCLNANATGANFAPCAESLTAAVALYTGNFLTGFTLPDAPAFDEWVFFQAESYRRALAQALQQLTAWHTNLAEFDAAIEYARRWLALDPLHEAAHRELMGLYAWDGQQAAAVRQYQECVRILENELGVPPEEETVALYEAIRTRRLSAPIGQPVEASIPSSPLHPLTLPPLPGFLRQESDSPPIPELFVARSQELLRLDGYLDKAVAGEGQIVFVRGEAGRGKSSLLNAFVRRSQARHPELLVAWGRCDAHTSAGNPYLPWRECTALLTGDVEARWAAGEISRTHAQRLWYALPVAAQALIEQAPALLDSFVPAAALAERAAVGWSGAAWLAQLRSRLVDDREWQPVEQDRLFAHFLRFLQALAARQPLLLLLDDLHWVDGSSADLLFHLVRRLGSAPVLIVGAFRGEEVQGESHPLQAALVELQRTFGDITLDLDEADRGGGRAFVDAFLDSEDNRLGEAFRAELTQRTGGHPLFTVELVQEMQDRGGLRQDEDGYWVETGALDWKRLPGRVEATVAARFNRLEQSAREMLTVGSVEGEEFTAEVIARVLGVEPLTVVRGLSGGADRQKSSPPRRSSRRWTRQKRNW